MPSSSPAKTAKRLIRKLLLHCGLEIARIPHRNNKGIFTKPDPLAALVGKLNIASKVCVDIGANDGLTTSNTYALFLDGWAGLAIDCAGQEFADLAYRYKDLTKVGLVRCVVTPENILPILRAHKLPANFGFLSLDIDGYDYFVLEQVLKEYRPHLICAEINEKIPPPVKFTVTYPNYKYRADNFYGQSLAQLHALCTRFNYSLVGLDYHNALLVDADMSPYPSLTPAEAYRTGYVEKPDRLERFPWNAEMEHLLNLSPEEIVSFIHTHYANRADEFICHL